MNNGLVSRYGITVEDYELMLDMQGGVCAICGKKETRRTRSSKKIWEYDIEPRLVVDHDHKTGKVRGLLCHRCNVGIGQLDDSIDMLQRGIRYLRKHE